MSNEAQGKTPAQALSDLADSVTLLRHDFEKLRNSTPNKEQAKFVADLLEDSANLMTKTASETDKELRRVSKTARQETLRIAATAAEHAVQEVGKKLDSRASKTFDMYRTAAEEARREARSYRGGFWTRIALSAVVGAFLGALAMLVTQGVVAARDFGAYPQIYCAAAGGSTGTNESGDYCVVYY